MKMNRYAHQKSLRHIPWLTAVDPKHSDMILVSTKMQIRENSKEELYEGRRKRGRQVEAYLSQLHLSSVLLGQL
jgi:hypothetical protein